MAWTDLTFPFGSKLTSTKMTQLFNNFQAVTDKDAGAPQLANNYIVNAMITDGTISNEKQEAYATGSELLCDATPGANALSIPDDTLRTRLSHRVARAGTLRFIIQTTCSLNCGSVTARVYRNGGAVGSAISGTTVDQDISGWSVDDTLEVKVFSSGIATTGVVNRCEIYSNNAGNSDWNYPYPNI